MSATNFDTLRSGIKALQTDLDCAQSAWSGQYNRDGLCSSLGTADNLRQFVADCETLAHQARRLLAKIGRRAPAPKE